MTLKNIIALLLIIFVFQFPIMAQHMQLGDSLNEVRNQNIRHMLDLRFRGGTGEFERQLLAAVEYTAEARRNCVLGVVILSFSVGCDNELVNFRMRNPLGHGLNEQLRSFFESTDGNWNECDDDRYTRFEIPVAFMLDKTQTTARGFFTIDGGNPGYRCRSDEYYWDRMNRFRERGRTKKALEMIDVLIHRDPLNSKYTEVKRALLSE